ncbi:TPA: cobalamin biosynthesis protein [Clostridioides difficile]|uniref:Cobalamin biosynthesis L-threonine PduX-like kinase n=6 Tax=Clostridioides difficile TaxID=1496 RepID=Q180T0_CLOD6|nr:serine/threonine protein kinase [Clostridioides difficile]EQF58117.1 GHMP kinase family protein [Clostridioides difficile CD196]EQG58207.1 GHMP kinase family protein [Clostridioides difficile DA00149]EQG73530.1 GHMP kinase family protein [Clostridioides difficile DA00165]EQI27135.1 GHMP kinase family protein [Clostridioides difficile Y184]EQK79679.1 GHMP kinase family protein [Clostridioides difficile CD127]CCL66485.1 Putative cobalamin biosynthesis L-threonine PduX-like kinase [Clostridio
MKSYGICPASCGEFVQGIIDDEEYLCSYAIDMYSKVYIEEKLVDINLGRYKSRLAIEKVFEKFNLPKKYTKNISLNINSKIPVGKGMASSTADIGATIKATLSLIDKDLSSEEISKLAAEIEPTDSIFIDKNSIFNPLNGTVIKYLGNLTNAKVVILEPNKVLDTMKIRLRQDYNKLKVENKEVIKKSFALLEEGLKKNNLSLVGEACTLSSLANENIEKKEYLNEIIKISKKYGAYGVNIAHSGTVVGILIDKFMNDKKMIDALCESNINSVYNKIYTQNIINGGIKGEIEWNT